MKYKVECKPHLLRTNYKMELYNDNEHQNFKKAFIRGTECQRYNEYVEFIEMCGESIKRS